MLTLNCRDSNYVQHKLQNKKLEQTSSGTLGNFTAPPPVWTQDYNSLL